MENRMKNVFLLLFAFCLIPVSAFAAQEGPVTGEAAAPHTALISPSGARLEVTQKLKIGKVQDKPVIEFILPADASNLQLSVPGRRIMRWSTTPALLDHGSLFAGRRAEIEQAQTETSARLGTVKARLALWQGKPQSMSAQDMSQLQSEMAQAMPALLLEQSRLERELKLLTEELSRMPAPSEVGERIRIVLDEDAKPGEMATVNYSYQHDGCGWEAIYEFDTRPNEGSGDSVNVRMLAEVWQFTGLNWKDTQITLATRSNGPREPGPIPEWIIDSANTRPQPRAAAHVNGAVTMALKDHAPDTAEGAGIETDTSSLYATWKLPERGLPQGRSRMLITAAAWKAPLQWIARPSRHSSQVWLMAKYTLPPNQAWPNGVAEYCVNGQGVGAGQFSPESGEATLYFGADPRMSIVTTTNSRTRGESGIINTSKSWTWSWTFTLHNDHDKPVTVKVERPLPMIVDKDVKVAYKNDPQPTEDAKEHLMYWLVDVPAHGSREIQHAVTLTSPTKLPLLPDVP